MMKTIKKTYKNLTATCLLLFFLSNIFAQEIFIVAYKGEISFSDGRKLNHNFRYQVNRATSVTFETDAAALLYAGDKYISVDRISIKTTYSYVQLVEQFNKSTKKNAGFSAYLQKTHLYANEVKEASKAAVPVAIKGIDDGKGRYVRDPFETIFPQDSVRALSGTVKLKWETTAKAFGTKMIVVNTTTNDTVYNKSAASKGEADIAVEREGVYKWFLYSKIENKKSIDRVIIKPSQAENVRLKNELEAFKKQIATFSEDLQLLVLDDYLYQNHIIE